MKAAKNKISGSKGVEICAKLLFTGKRFGEVVSHCVENYSVSESCVGKWIKKARPLVADMQKEADDITSRELGAAIAESAKKLNLTRDRILEEYKKLALFDPRKLYHPDGTPKKVCELDDDTAGALSGIENIAGRDDKVPMSIVKVKMGDKKGALDSICRVMGYNAPAKFEVPPDIDLGSLQITFK